MRKFIARNKMFSGIVAILFTSLITYSVLFGRWVTDKIYCHEEKISSSIQVQLAENKAISKQVEEVKQDVKEIKDELSKAKKEAGEDGVKLRKDIADNQKELLKLLIDLKKSK